MKSLFLAAAAILAVAGSAQAQAVTATLVAPVAKPRQLVLDATVWNCAEGSCQAVTGNADTASWRACKALVARVGKVSAYAGLDAAQLARCNGETK